MYEFKNYIPPLISVVYLVVGGAAGPLYTLVGHKVEVPLGRVVYTYTVKRLKRGNKMYTVHLNLGLC